jgi:hypothetical protein
MDPVGTDEYVCFQRAAVGESSEHAIGTCLDLGQASTVLDARAGRGGAIRKDACKCVSG